MDTMSSAERWAKIDATLDRATALAEENEKGIKELRAAIAESGRVAAERSREFDLKLNRMAEEREIEAKKAAEEREIEAKKVAKEREKAAKEREIADKIADEKREKAAKEREESLAKLEKSVAETTKGIDKMYKSICGVKEELGGISKSNGMVSEDYFFASLYASKMLGGVHFDDVQDNVGGMVKLSDGTKIKGQYDIVMYNDTAVCIVEVKYRLRKEDVLDVANRYADNFRKLFPAYADYKIYLAVGGMVIEKDAMETAKQYGMGILKQNGDAVVVYDENLKVY